MMAGKAERCAPVEVTYLDVHASGALQDRSVAVSAVIDDAHLSARAKDPDGFAKRLGAFLAAGMLLRARLLSTTSNDSGGKGRSRASASRARPDR